MILEGIFDGELKMVDVLAGLIRSTRVIRFCGSWLSTFRSLNAEQKMRWWRRRAKKV